MIDPILIILAAVILGLFVFAAWFEAREYRKEQDRQEADQYKTWKESAYPETMADEDVKQMHAARWDGDRS